MFEQPSEGFSRLLKNGRTIRGFNKDFLRGIGDDDLRALYGGSFCFVLTF